MSEIEVLRCSSSTHFPLTHLQTLVQIRLPTASFLPPPQIEEDIFKYPSHPVRSQNYLHYLGFIFRCTVSHGESLVMLLRVSTGRMGILQCQLIWLVRQPPVCSANRQINKGLVCGRAQRPQRSHTSNPPLALAFSFRKDSCIKHHTYSGSHHQPHISTNWIREYIWKNIRVIMSLAIVGWSVDISSEVERSSRIPRLVSSRLVLPVCLAIWAQNQRRNKLFSNAATLRKGKKLFCSYLRNFHEFWFHSISVDVIQLTWGFAASNEYFTLPFKWVHFNRTSILVWTCVILIWRADTTYIEVKRI